MKAYKVIWPQVDEYGTIRWYNEMGQLHREDGPAFEGVSGDKEWYLNDQCHREDGPAVEWASGHKEWYLNGQLHREDGPAIESADGDKKWWLNGQRHREDGPAVEYTDGIKKWYLNGQELTEEEFNKRTQSHKEMTVAQLEQELGYKIKVVKG